MRVRLAALGACVALLAVLAGTGPSGAHERSQRAPARLLVSGDEYSLMLSRRSIARGPALIQFLNRGEDLHDLRMRRIGRMTGYAVKAPKTGPGRLVSIDAHLAPGRYRLWCSLPGHRRRGMHTVLSVRH